jgi:hypothetical protein
MSRYLPDLRFRLPHTKGYACHDLGCMLAIHRRTYVLPPPPPPRWLGAVEQRPTAALSTGARGIRRPGA